MDEREKKTKYFTQKRFDLLLCILVLITIVPILSQQLSTTASATISTTTTGGGAVGGEEVMGEMDTIQFAEQFVNSGRSGRRNAMPDLGVDNVDIGAHKLAEAFSQLDAGNEAGPSSASTQ